MVISLDSVLFFKDGENINYVACNLKNDREGRNERWSGDILDGDSRLFKQKASHE